MSDILSLEPVRQSILDWDSLSPNEFNQAAIEYHHELNRQEAVVDSIKQSIVLKKGLLYLSVKDKSEHGDFLKWLDKVNVTWQNANHYMKIASELAEEISNHSHGSDLSFHFLREIAYSVQPLLLLGKVQSGNIKTLKELKEAKKELKEAKDAQGKAEEQTRITQRELFEEKEKSKKQIECLTNDIQSLKSEIEGLSKPEEVIKEVDKPETKKRIEELEAKVKKLTEQRENLSRLVDELSADVEANEVAREQEARNARVRQEWQRGIDAIHKSVNQFLLQLPSSIDTQLLESDDWARLDEVIEIFHRGIETCNRLRKGPPLVIVDAG